MGSNSGSGAIISAPGQAMQGVAAHVSSVFPAKGRQLYRLSETALKNGVHIVAGPGAGKSRLMGRLIVWQQLHRRKPQVILDPVGGVTDNLPDKISRLPVEQRRELWPHLLYVDVGATDFIVPSPLYYKVSPRLVFLALTRNLQLLIIQPMNLRRMNSSLCHRHNFSSSSAFIF